MLDVHKSQLAEKDLIDIWRYTETTWGEQQADFYLDQIEQHLVMLCKDVSIGKDCGHIREGYRSFKSGKHMIFYKVDANILMVVRVLHERMNIKAHLSS